MSYRYQLITLIAVAISLAACQDSSTPNAGAKAESGASLSDAARFDREIRKRGCEILTARLVSTTFDVPADDLRQMKIMGCRYDWENDSDTLEAGISMLRAHKSEKAAAGWFANATKSRTAQEMQAEMEQVSRRMSESEALDTEAKKSMARGILAAAGSKAVNFDDVDGVGDEARVNDDGNIYVRVDNLTFIVSAYKGAKAPPLDLKRVDLKQMAAVAKESAAQWAIETASQRRADGARLARVITDEL